MEDNKPKDRYHTSEKYREQQIERSKKYYHRNKKLKVRVPNKVVSPTSRPLMVEFENGNREFAFKIGYVAEALARTVETVRKWIKEGVIPDTPYKATGGRRLYTESMVRAMQNALKGMGYPAYLNKKEFSKQVKKRWPKMHKIK